MAGTGYYGYLVITLDDVRGIPSSEVSLEIQLWISADGFAPGIAR
jgi:hypothetical protein